MEWVQEVSVFIQGIAWPVVVLIAVVLLRDELRTLMGRLTGVTGPAGIGASFERDARGLPTGDDAELAQSRGEHAVDRSREASGSSSGADGLFLGDSSEGRSAKPEASAEVQAIVASLWDYRTEMLHRFAEMQSLAAQAPSTAVETAWQEVRRSCRKAEAAVGSVAGVSFYGQHPYLAVKEIASIPGYENLSAFADWAKELGNLSGRARREEVSADAARSFVESADGFVSHYLGAVVVLLSP